MVFLSFPFTSDKIEFCGTIKRSTMLSVLNVVNNMHFDWSDVCMLKVKLTLVQKNKSCNITRQKIPSLMWRLALTGYRFEILLAYELTARKKCVWCAKANSFYNCERCMGGDLDVRPPVKNWKLQAILSWHFQPFSTKTKFSNGFPTDCCFRWK